MTTVTGTLSTMSVPDLLQWLLTGGKTGVLGVVRNGIEKRLFFSKGAIVGASSSDPDLAFGQFLLDLGKIDEATLVALVRKQRETGTMLGKLLTLEGILSESDVLDVLQWKARETIFELMAWREGDFEFTDEVVADGDQVPLRIPVDSVIFEGIRKAEVRRKMREAFPTGNLAPALLSDEARVELLSDPRAAPMVSLMDTGKTLREIARELSQPVVEVCEVLYPYLAQGMLVVGMSGDPEIPHYYVTEAPRPAALPEVPLDVVAGDLGAPDPAKLVELAEIFQKEGQLEEAMATIERADELAPESSLVKAALARIEHDFVASLWEFFEDGGRVPVLAVGLRDLPSVKPMLTSEEAFIATRISGGDSVKEIVDMSPLSELKTLRILRTFAEAELVIFRERLATETAP